MIDLDLGQVLKKVGKFRIMFKLTTCYISMCSIMKLC